LIYETNAVPVLFGFLKIISEATRRSPAAFATRLFAPVPSGDDVHGNLRRISARRFRLNITPAAKPGGAVNVFRGLWTHRIMPAC
jgi:hypothetical protein